MNKVEEELKNKGIQYEIREYSKECKNALEASREIGFPYEQMFKSLLCNQNEKYILVLLPSPNKINFIKLNKQMNSNYTFANVNDIERITGYEMGTVSPIGTKQSIDVIIDTSCKKYNQISVGCGEYGKELLISPDDLALITEARLLDLC